MSAPASPAAERLERDAALRYHDAEARRSACAVFDRPLVVEAGAGTGKTTTLVARIVTWCVGPGWQRAQDDLASPDGAQPDHVHTQTHPQSQPARARAESRTQAQGDLFAAREAETSHELDPGIARQTLAGLIAITFTEAATAEMGRRIQQAFVALGRGEIAPGLHADLLPAPATRERRARALADALERPVVQTIHAWCQSLLCEFALEAGLDPSFAVDVDGLEVADACREALEARLVEALGDPPDRDYLTLARRGFGPHRIEEALLALARSGVRASDLAGDPLTPARIEALVASLAREIELFLALCAASLGAAGVRSKTTADVLYLLSDARQRALEPKSRTLSGLQELCADLAQHWTAPVRTRLAEWAAGTFNASETKALAGREAQVQRAAATLEPAIRCLRRLDPELLDSARRVVADLLRGVAGRLRARGVEGFSDLLRDARDLVRDHPEVCRRIRRRTRQIFVDEFQDTDALQCDLVRAIALAPSASPPAFSASAREPEDAERPGLFLVGDPKQSIYGWRNADLGAYERFVADVVAGGGALLRLSVNRRSTRGILAEVERVVRPVMHATSGVQPAFEPLIAERGERVASEDPEKLDLPVDFWVSWELADEPVRLGQTRSDDACAIEARLVAHDLLRAHASGVDWRETAILMRSTSVLEVYLQALREAGIPYEVSGDRSYFRRREIIEAAALVRAVIDPTDHVALLAVLRSCSVGVPDAALIPLWNQGFPALVTELDDARAASLAPIEAAIARAHALVPADVPGLERIAGWERSLMAAVGALGALRHSFHGDPFDLFVEKLRAAFLIEATESARYLGAYRLANLERFFGRLLDALEEEAGDVRAILRAQSRALSEARDAEEARPKDGGESAVQVLTIHKAKGLEFERVYVVALHRANRRDALPFAAVDTRGAETSFALFGTASPGYEAVETRRRETEAAERVRTLYVAMTRAKNRLVLAGTWPDAIKLRGWRECATYVDLLAWSAPPGICAELQACAASERREIDMGDARFVLPPATPIVLAPPLEAALPPIDWTAAEAGAREVAERARSASIRMTRPFTALSLFAGSTASPTDRDGSGALLPVEAEGLETSVERDRRAILAALRGAWLEDDAQLELGDALPRAQRRRERIERALTPARAAEALALDERFVGGPLSARLAAVERIATSVPMQLAGGESGAVGSVTASIDLVYRDRASGAEVVALWTLGASGDARARSEHQACEIAEAGRIGLAWRDALGLAAAPRCELWHLDTGEIVACDA